MTRDALVKAIDDYRRRLAELPAARVTRHEKATYTRNLHALRRHERMLEALDKTGTVSNWHLMGGAS